jgi:hypothetical protein
MQGAPLKRSGPYKIMITRFEFVRVQAWTVLGTSGGNDAGHGKFDMSGSVSSKLGPKILVLGSSLVTGNAKAEISKTANSNRERAAGTS